MEEIPLFLEEILWPGPLPLKPSAFTRYTKPPESSENSIVAPNDRNMNKRMLALLRSIQTMKNTHRDSENDRSYQHMMNERFRRDKHKQSYAALHSILPTSTKIYKNSIVRMATLRVQELKGIEEELQKRNCELEEILKASEGVKAETMKMSFRVGSLCAIDSMVAVLRCLKGLDLKTRSIRSDFSEEGFSAVIEIESKIEAAIVEQVLVSAVAGGTI